MANKNLVFFCLIPETHMGKFVVKKKTNIVEVRKSTVKPEGLFLLNLQKNLLCRFWFDIGFIFILGYTGQ